MQAVSAAAIQTAYSTWEIGSLGSLASQIRKSTADDDAQCIPILAEQMCQMSYQAVRILLFEPAHNF